MATTTDNAGTAGDYIPYNLYPPADTDTVWVIRPDCMEAITILEEAEYELKELLKKNPTVKNIEIALRSTQAALRALLKVG